MCWNPGKLLSSAFSILGAEIQGPTAEEKSFVTKSQAGKKRKAFFRCTVCLFHYFIKTLWEGILSTVNYFSVIKVKKGSIAAKNRNVIKR